MELKFYSIKFVNFEMAIEYGYNPIPSIPSTITAFGITFLIILYPALTSAFKIIPFLLRNNPLLIRFPA